MLLSRPRIYTDECLVGYLIRVSERNGFRHISHLLHHAGLPWKNARAPVHGILTNEFDLSNYLAALGLPDQKSEIGEVCQNFKRVIDTPYILVKYPKVCPECLREYGYCKSYWALLPILACTEHQKLLVDIRKETGERLSWYRENLDRFAATSVAITNNDVPVTPDTLQFSAYIESVLAKKVVKKPIPLVLHGLVFREALTMINFLAHYQVRLQGTSFKPIPLKKQFTRAAL
ncbi:TniQ family protein [Microbulbifer sp. SSSA007]|uniref:TniQ family protein n=1 Tax=Microbulbifer sp. SSSA007 TaxID=3243379 RepID=UPI004039DAA3